MPPSEFSGFLGEAEFVLPSARLAARRGEHVLEVPDALVDLEPLPGTISSRARTPRWISLLREELLDHFCVENLRPASFFEKLLERHEEGAPWSELVRLRDLFVREQESRRRWRLRCWRRRRAEAVWLRASLNSETRHVRPRLGLEPDAEDEPPQV